MDGVEIGVGDAATCFSVIIPVYNRAHQLAACIASVRAQTFRDFELIVVDDGSTDGTCDALVDAEDLRIVTKVNGGPASARNFGADVARGRYLFFLDSDDLAFPWTLASFLAAIEEGEEPEIVCGNFIEFLDTPPMVHSAPVETVRYRDYLEAAAGGLYAAGGMIAVRRDVFLAVGGFDPTMKVAEDHDLMLRLGERPGFVHVIKPPTYAKHEHVGSISKVLTLYRAGCASLVEHLNAGVYGTSARARQIAGAMVGSHLRSAIVTLARNGLARDSIDLYLRSFGINLRDGRTRFLLFSPVLIALGKIKGLLP